MDSISVREIQRGFSHEILEAVVLAISRKVSSGVCWCGTRETSCAAMLHGALFRAVKDHAGAPFVFRPATPSITFLGKTSRL